jgi:hypothetical protein
VIFPVTNSSECSSALDTNALRNPEAISAYSRALRGHVHHLTVPDHKALRLGTLSAILSDAADYLHIERSKLEQELFDK